MSGSPVRRGKSADHALFLRIHRIVTRVVARGLAPDEEREDVVHDVLLRVLSNFDLRDLEVLDVWVARITRNVVCNTLRARRVRSIVSLNGNPERLLIAYTSDVEGRELAVRVAEAIARLPAVDRDLLCKRWFSTSTPIDLARHQGCSERTIKRRLSRAHQRFARIALADRVLAAGLAERCFAAPET